MSFSRIKTAIAAGVTVFGLTSCGQSLPEIDNADQASLQPSDSKNDPLKLPQTIVPGGGGAGGQPSAQSVVRVGAMNLLTNGTFDAGSSNFRGEAADGGIVGVWQRWAKVPANETNWEIVNTDAGPAMTFNCKASPCPGNAVFQAVKRPGVPDGTEIRFGVSIRGYSSVVRGHVALIQSKTDGTSSVLSLPFVAYTAGFDKIAGRMPVEANTAFLRLDVTIYESQAIIDDAWMEH